LYAHEKLRANRYSLIWYFDTPLCHLFLPPIIAKVADTEMVIFDKFE